MCHRRGDWSRTSSRASEPETESDDDSPWVGARAKDLLATYVSIGASESDREESEPEREPPERPAVEPDPETPSATESEVGDEPESEREEDPIPADD